MRRIFPLLLLFASARYACSQGVIWERTFGVRAYDNLTDVTSVDSGKFIACGTRFLYGHVIPNSTSWVSDISITKFNSNGDTLWTKSTGFGGENPVMCDGPDNTFYLGFYYPTVWATPDDGLNILRIDTGGNVLNRWVIPQTAGGAYPARMIRANDGTLLVVGIMAPPTGTSGSDMIVARIEPTHGFLYFLYHYRDHLYTYGKWIEETPNHTYLASGTAGSRVWAIEIDTNGIEIKRQTMYQSQSLAFLDDVATVQQAPEGRYVVAGSTATSSPQFYYLGSYADLSSNSQVWGGEQPINILPPSVQNDGSLLVLNYRNNLGYFTRLAMDSSTIWEIPILSQLSNRQPVFSAFAYSGDSVGIGVGSLYVNSLDDQFYFCRIQNLGQPYNPTATKPLAKRNGLPPLIAYPTPVTTSLTVHTRAKEPLQLMNISGQVVLRYAPVSDGTTVLDVSALPAGLYFLRQGRSTVKVVKN